MSILDVIGEKLNFHVAKVLSGNIIVGDVCRIEIMSVIVKL